MDYVIKILREECTGTSTELRDIVDSDPEQGVYFVGNYKTHQNDRFTTLTEAKQHQANLLQEWQQEEDLRLANQPKSNTDHIPDFTLPTSYL